jgi:hypothetical protein
MSCKRFSINRGIDSRLQSKSSEAALLAVVQQSNYGCKDRLSTAEMVGEKRSKHSHISPKASIVKDFLPLENL